MGGKWLLDVAWKQVWETMLNAEGNLSMIEFVVGVHDVFDDGNLGNKLTLDEMSGLNKIMLLDIVTLARTEGWYGGPMTFAA
jgi:hypothetical protein